MAKHITRAAHMQALTEVGSPDTPEKKARRKEIHHEYYLQFSNQYLQSLVSSCFDLDTLRAAYAQDENFNSPLTPLAQWDRLFGYFHASVNKTLLKETGEGMSLSTCVCTCKAIATELVNQSVGKPAIRCRKFQRKWIQDGVPHKLVCDVKLNRSNSEESFSISSELFISDRLAACGQLDDLIVEHLPEVAPLLRWHLYGYGFRGGEWRPLHYPANPIYLAGDKDCHGLRRGEIKYGEPLAHAIGGIPAKAEWCERYRRPDGAIPLKMIDPGYIGKIESVSLGEVLRRGEGKERDLEGARRAAIWPDATDLDLTEPGLEQRLLDRLPKLFTEFQAAMKGLGFKVTASSPRSWG